MVGSFIVIKMALQLDLACFYVDGERGKKATNCFQMTWIAGIPIRNII